MSLIYKITNDVNGKIYVGKTEYSEILDSNNILMIRKETDAKTDLSTKQ